MTAEEPKQLTFDTLVSLCKRRGFVFPSSEIYGGIAGFWDYGPLGVEMKNNIKRVWWKAMVQERDDVVGIDASIIMNPKVWEASGHVATFTDPMVDCKNCKHRFRADHVEGDVCPDCGAKGQFTEARAFNLMFKTHVGPVEDDGQRGLPAARDGAGHVRQLRQRRDLDAPQAALRHRADRPQLPQRDHAGELHLPRPRVRADGDGVLLQAGRLQAVARPLAGAAPRLVQELGVREENLRIREHAQEELSHYSNGTYDIEYNFAAMGWSELEGIASRTDFDLKAHAKAQRQGADLLRRRGQRAHRPLRHRAGRRRRPHLPRRCSTTPTARRRCGGREARLPAAHPAGGADQGRRAAAVAQREAVAAGA